MNPVFLEVIAPFKINLNLHIIGVNHYNYHLIQGVTVFTDEGDSLKVSLEKSDEDKLIIQGQFSNNLIHENISNNLIIKAVKNLRKRYKFPKLKIILEKNIPIQAGYGGGSSDAAAILKAVNNLFSLNIPFDELIEIGKLLGADVPMCLYGKPCFVQNIGDDIQFLQPLNKKYYCLLLKPTFMLSTPLVFQNLKNKYNLKIPNTKNLIEYAISEGRNDLWTAAIAIKPELEIYLQALSDTCPIKASMSGSGSGLFAIYNKFQECHDAFSVIKQIFPNDFIMETNINL